VTDIALHGGSYPLNARRLEKRYGLRKRHLESVLQVLAREGILAGIRGPGGGYKLAREPARISAQEILRATAITSESRRGRGDSRLLQTIVEPIMAQAERAFIDQLSRISIEDLMRLATATLQSEREQDG
jgi:Rrf2 family protein